MDKIESKLCTYPYYRYWHWYPNPSFVEMIVAEIWYSGAKGKANIQGHLVCVKLAVFKLTILIMYFLDSYDVSKKLKQVIS